jgi:hypothetical protein
MVLAIPGGRGIFSHLQLALRHSDRTRIHLTHQPVRDKIEDFWALAQDIITSRPTSSISDIIPTSMPSQFSACNATKSGAGGVWLPPDCSPSSPASPTLLPSLLWRTTWPAPIQSQLITDAANPRGTLTSSDLELSGTILHQDVLTSHIDCRTNHVIVSARFRVPLR